jgi:hypothetical protein
LFSQGLASPSEFVENYRHEVFSSDGKVCMANIDRRQDSKLLRPFNMSGIDLQGQPEHPQFLDRPV